MYSLQLKYIIIFHITVIRKKLEPSFHEIHPKKCEFVLKDSICHKEYHADTDALESTRHELSSHCIHNSPTAADPNLQSRLHSQMSILEKKHLLGHLKFTALVEPGLGSSLCTLH